MTREVKGTKMETEFCFICAVKLGRGNRSEIGRQEKMDKLAEITGSQGEDAFGRKEK